MQTVTPVEYWLLYIMYWQTVTHSQMWAAIFSVTKVLLEHSDTIHLLNIYGCFYATKGSSSFDRDHMLTKPGIFIICLFMEKIVDLWYISLILSYIHLLNKC